MVRLLRLLAPDPALFISPQSVTRLQVGCTKTSPKRKQIVQYYVHKGSKLRREYEVENAGADGGRVIFSLNVKDLAEVRGCCWCEWCNAVM